MSVPSTTDIVPPLKRVSLQRSAGDVPRDTGRRGRSPKPSGGPQGGPLDTYANNLDTLVSDAAQERFLKRTEEAKIRGTIRKISQLQRVRKCGHTIRRKEGIGLVADMTLPSEKRISGFRGLYSCASVWACKRCSAVIGIQRVKEVRKAVDEWVTNGAVIPQGRYVPDDRWIEEDDQWFDPETGEIRDKQPRKKIFEDVEHASGEIAFLTLTIRHKSTDDLDTMWRAISKAWERTTRSNNILKRGMPGYIRAAELTHGKNGFHLHLHVILLVPSGWSSSVETDAKDNRPPHVKHGDSIFKTWKESVGRLGYESYKSAFDLSMITSEKDIKDAVEKISRYTTKASKTWDVALELAGAFAKTASGDNLSPQQILAVIHADMSGFEHSFTDAQISRYRAVYATYEEASHGKRQMTWSAGLKKAMKIDEIDDQKIADNTDDDGTEDEKSIEELNKNTEEIAGFVSDSWWMVRDLRTRIQRATETSDKDSVHAELTATIASINPLALTGFFVGDEWRKRLPAVKKKEAS